MQQYEPILADIRTMVIDKARTSTFVEEWFLQDHLLEVEEIALWLCGLYPDADKEVVLLSVWLHDYGRLIGADDDHAQVGTDFTKKYLTEHLYFQEKTNFVYDAILTHGVDGQAPQSLEGQILATADACSHFEKNFYFRIFLHFSQTKPFDKVIESIRTKLQRDYHQKMFLKEAKERYKERYEAWCVVLK